MPYLKYQSQLLITMSKADDLLKACKENVGNWTCAVHPTDSNQPAAIFREVKKLGYEFEEQLPGRWAKRMYCPKCNKKTTHYKLLNSEPLLTIQTRLRIDEITRNHILELFDNRDAFTSATITSTPEIDHKIPWTRLDNDIDATILSEDEIKEHFQLLTREHNLLKDRACSKCRTTNIRTPFLEIPFWYQGDSSYKGTCIGCGWYDGVKWREEISKHLKIN